jgi:hypothetical protein
MEVRMTTAAWLPDNRTVVTAGNQGLFIRDATAGTVIKRLALPTQPSPRPWSLYSECGDSEIRRCWCESPATLASYMFLVCFLDLKFAPSVTP